MDNFRYFLSSAYLREIEDRFPLGDAVIVDIDPSGEYFDRVGPEGFDDATGGVLKALSERGVEVMGRTYDCVRGVPQRVNSETEVIIARKSGQHLVADIEGCVRDAVPDTDPYVCSLTETMAEV